MGDKSSDRTRKTQRKPAIKSIEMTFNTYYLDLVENNRPLPPCDCHLTVMLRTSTILENPTRRFLNCRNSLTTERKCKWFRWVDPELSRHYKSEVTKLMNEIIKLREEPVVEQLKSQMKEERTKYDADLDAAAVGCIVHMEEQLAKEKSNSARKQVVNRMLVGMLVGLFIWRFFV